MITNTEGLLAETAEELGAPISAIVCMVDRVLETAIAGHQRQTLELVRAAAADALGMTHDLLDLARLESGDLALDETSFFLRATVARAIRALTPRARQRRLELVHSIDPAVPDALVGDADRLRRILCTFLASAIAHTDAGSIALEVDLEQADRPLLRFSIRNGAPGAGVAARAAHRLIGRMGGEVTALPGTVAFTARFQLQPIATPAGGRRVLVVGDDGEERRALDAWLREAGIDTTTVGDCLGAMDHLWESVTSRRPFAAVLVELDSRRTKAAAFVTRIRARPELAATPIVHLPRPIVRDDVLAVLRDLE